MSLEDHRDYGEKETGRMDNEILKVQDLAVLRKRRDNKISVGGLQLRSREVSTALGCLTG